MWLEGSAPEQMPPGERLRSLLARPGVLQVPGAHHAQAGLLAKEASFEALCVSGGALTAGMGLPDLGKIVIWPVSSLRVAADAVRELYAQIRAEGGTDGMKGRMQTRAELYRTIGYHDYEALDGSIARSVLPSEAAE